MSILCIALENTDTSFPPLKCTDIPFPAILIAEVADKKTKSNSMIAGCCELTLLKMGSVPVEICNCCMGGMLSVTGCALPL